MAAGDLVSIAQALASLGQLSDPLGIVAGLVSAVSTQIQNFISYQVASATYTRTFNGSNSDRLLLPDRPVTAVSAVTVDSAAMTASVAGGDGFLFDAKFVYLRGCQRFTRGVQNVMVTYTAGFDAVPPDIMQACLNWLGSAWALVGEDPSVKMMRAGDTQIEFGNLQTILTNNTLLIPPAIASALQPYQRVASS